jgi:sulfatase modifying factor 1
MLIEDEGLAVHWMVRAMLLLALGMVAVEAAAAEAGAVRPASCGTIDAVMVDVPAGLYRPFFRDARREREKPVVPIAVEPFRIDTGPVTRAQFLSFVCRHPQWRRSAVKALFAEAGYLSDWSGDFDAGTTQPDRPVTYVSWFAARAYCAARGARLPSVHEFERVAGQAGTDAAMADDAAASPFAFAMGRPAADMRAAGLRFPGVWEWNADFNSAPLAASSNDGARSAGSLFCGDGFRSTNAADYAAFLRHSLRASLRADYTLKNLGFRCAS